MAQKNFSIQTKIISVFTAGFLAILVVSSLVTMHNEQELVDNLLTSQLHDTAQSYFDSVNTMMLTGSMAQRDVLRGKLLERANILDARIIRSKGVDALLDATKARIPHELPQDALDHRTLSGESITQIGKNGDGRTLSVLLPLKASANYNGTNCLTCHQVKEGVVLGAVRIDMSLASIDNNIHADLLNMLLINAVLFAIGLGLFNWLFRSLVSNRMKRLANSMARIADDSDLSTRIKVLANDEIGRVSTAFNHMADEFHNSLNEVANTSQQLNHSATEINQVVGQTTHSIQQQQSETDSVASAINALSATANQVRESARQAAEVSVSADNEAAQGARLNTEVIDGIGQLISEMSQAAEVIGQLANRSNDVGSILDVIKGIAEQTNLLALNAAIEAARAGEQGRGFAVVADEVRNLASRSHESTQEIESIIAQLQEDARKAVNSMQTARESAQKRSEQVQQAVANLNTISGIVADIRQLNTQMDMAANEQCEVTGSISHNIVQITQLADKTSEDAQRTASASEYLLHLAQQLNEMIAKFKLS